jgi:hypothetical protein
VRSLDNSSSKVPALTRARAVRAPSSANLPTPPKGKKWLFVPSLSDEFNGAQLDPRKWMPHHPYWEGRAPSKFREGNVRVADGRLQLSSTSRVASMSDVRRPLVDIWVNSAAVSSVAPTVGLGYYESRIKASRLSMTSSFWFQNQGGEIDVVEQVGKPSNPTLSGITRFMNSNIHVTNNGKMDNSPQLIPMDSTAANDYHVYAMWWRDSRTVTFYLNGRPKSTVHLKAALATPMWMFFDTEVFTWAGLPTIASLKDTSANRMLVDYVRAWKLVRA